MNILDEYKHRKKFYKEHPEIKHIEKKAVPLWKLILRKIRSYFK